MPKIGLKFEGEMTTRSAYTKMDVELSFSVSGRELPSQVTLGKAFEEAIEKIQLAITEAYKMPERVTTV